MSKEQTPITAEELFSEIWGIIDLEQREKVKLKAGTILDIEQVIEQYAQAKVLEALEREVPKAVYQQCSAHSHSDLDCGTEYYETEVKPKYKQINK